MIVLFGMSEKIIHGFSILLKFLITFEFNVHEDKVLKLKFKNAEKDDGWKENWWRGRTFYKTTCEPLKYIWYNPHSMGSNLSMFQSKKKKSKEKQ